MAKDKAVAFVRELSDSVRAGLGRAVALEFRMDAAFFQRDLLWLLVAGASSARESGPGTPPEHDAGSRP